MSVKEVKYSVMHPESVKAFIETVSPQRRTRLICNMFGLFTCGGLPSNFESFLESEDYDRFLLERESVFNQKFENIKGVSPRDFENFKKQWEKRKEEVFLYTNRKQ